jgi:type I restriction enzyme, S subunit
MSQNIPIGWKLLTLSQVADIVPSNVDKKIYQNEIPVFLCNYMDVYSNDYLSYKVPYSNGSVTFAELQKFKLKKGDVIITKDSETPDDIAVPAVVTEDMPNVVCGYHLAVIRPKEYVVGVYLSKILQTHFCRRHFGNTANGATRYGLTIKVIETCPIVLPPESEQTTIATILTTIDQAIEKTEQLIAKYERIKTGLMQDLLTRGVDENGNIRSEETHEFQKTRGIKHPNEWKVIKLQKYLRNIEQGWSPNCESENASPFEWGILKTSSVTWEGYKENENKKLPLNINPKKRYEILEGDVLITRAGPNSRVGVVAYVDKTRSKLILSDKIYRLSPNDELIPKYLALALSSQFTQKFLEGFKTGMAESQTNISQEIVKNLEILLPEDKEQKLIIEKLDTIEITISKFRIELKKLFSTKTALMQDLLTGKVRVDALMKSDKMNF